MKVFVTRKAAGLVAGAISAVALGLLAGRGPLKAADAAQAAASDQVERGEYLVKILGCNDCHTPMKLTPMGPASDMTRYLSGHPETMKLPPPPKLPPGPWLVVSAATATAYAGPWGVTYAPNLTPDTNTGLGIWTEKMFIDAMKLGKHMGTSRPILPPMPIQAYSNMTEEDLKAVFAYLKSIPAISNRVPEAEIAGAKKEFVEDGEK